MQVPLPPHAHFSQVLGGGSIVEQSASVVQTLGDAPPAPPEPVVAALDAELTELVTVLVEVPPEPDVAAVAA